MKQTVRSFGHAAHGLVHAIREERNLRCFILGHTGLLLLGIFFRINLLSLLILTFVAGIFVTTELLNTAIERLADTVDDDGKTRGNGYYHLGIKQTKDVAAAASLIMLTLYLGCVTIVVVPYVLYFFVQL